MAYILTSLDRLVVHSSTQLVQREFEIICGIRVLSMESMFELEACKDAECAGIDLARDHFGLQMVSPFDSCWDFSCIVACEQPKYRGL